MRITDINFSRRIVIYVGPALGAGIVLKFVCYRRFARSYCLYHQGEAQYNDPFSGKVFLSG